MGCVAHTSVITQLFLPLKKCGTWHKGKPYSLIPHAVQSGYLTLVTFPFYSSGQVLEWGQSLVLQRYNQWKYIFLFIKGITITTRKKNCCSLMKLIPSFGLISIQIVNKWLF